MFIPASENSSAGWVDVLVYVLPLVQFIQIPMVGNLLGSDILFLVVFFGFLMRGELRLQHPLAKRCILLCWLWFVFQFLTDYVRQSAFEDYARGWSKILLTLVSFSVLFFLLYGQRRRILVFGWGLVAGTVMAFWLNPDYLAIDYPWKFGISYPLTLAVFLLMSRRPYRPFQALLWSIVMGCINIYLNARSRGGFCLATAAYLLAGILWKRRGSPPVCIRFKTVLLSLAAMVLVGAAILSTYEYAANAGFLGEDAKQKYEAQVSGKLGLLVGGRSDLLGAFAAIYDSPVFGHGSWARDPRYVLLDLQAMAQFGYEDTASMENELINSGFRIPAHSFLLEAWVEAGIAGALFWGWIFALGLGALFRFGPLRVDFSPLAAFSVFSLLWDIAFSPYGTVGSVYRLIAPYYIVILMTCIGALAPEPARARVSDNNPPPALLPPTPVQPLIPAIEEGR